MTWEKIVTNSNYGLTSARIGHIDGPTINDGHTYRFKWPDDTIGRYAIETRDGVVTTIPIINLIYHGQLIPVNLMNTNCKIWLEEEEEEEKEEEPKEEPEEEFCFLYSILKSNRIDFLVNDTEGYLNEGWEIAGGMIPLHDSNTDEKTFYQTVTKKVKK